MFKNLVRENVRLFPLLLHLLGFLYLGRCDDQYYPDLVNTCPSLDRLVATGNIQKTCTVDSTCLFFDCSSAGIFTNFTIFLEPCVPDSDDPITVVHVVATDFETGVEYFIISTHTDAHETVTRNVDTSSIVTVDVHINVFQEDNGIIFGVDLYVQEDTTANATIFTLFEPTLIEIFCIEDYPPPSPTPPPTPTSSPPPTTTTTLSTDIESLTATIVGGVVPTAVVLILAVLVIFIVLFVYCKLKRRTMNTTCGLPALPPINSQNTIAKPEICMRDRAKSNQYTVSQATNSTSVDHYELECTDGSEIYDEVDILRPVFSVSNEQQLKLADFNWKRHDIDEEWLYPRNKLVYLKDIDQGTFSKFMIMEASDIANISGKINVVAKALNDTSTEFMKHFNTEVKLRKEYIHDNIVAMLGLCLKGGNPLIILELMEYGDLQTFLRHHGPTDIRKAVIGYDDFYQYATDIVSALDFLAFKGYTHGAVAAKNCLVGHNFVVKLSGFPREEENELNKDGYCLNEPLQNSKGCTNKRVSQSNRQSYLGQTEGLLRWKAPEVTVYGKSSLPADVWSFGMLLWEMSTYGNIPYPNMSTNEVLQMAYKNNLEIQLPPEAPDAYKSLFERCTSTEPSDRPPFSEVYQHLSKRMKGGSAEEYDYSMYI